MTAARKIRVVIVDDHPVVRDGLKTLLSAAPDIEVAGEAADGRAAIAAWREHEPDVMLVDLRMPRMDGVDAIAAILRTSPAARIIVLTTFAGDEEIHRALRLGARAYLLKEAFGDEILAAVRAVHAGRKHVPPAVAARLAERPIDRALTLREVEVLELIARGRGNREIGEQLSIAEGTVKAHVNSILAKLGAQDRTDAAMIALKRGIIRLE
jgi:two-component system NarL family response regulator